MNLPRILIISTEKGKANEIAISKLKFGYLSHFNINLISLIN